MSNALTDVAKDARRAVREGPAGIARRQRRRFGELVAFARRNSPYYRELYSGLPDPVDDPTLLPVTSKRELMDHFDGWVTDRSVTRARVEEFVSHPELVGTRFLGDYLVATTSGTSGVRGLFVFDDFAAGMESALASRARGLVSPGDTLKMLARGGRTAIVTAPGGHFFTVASTARFQADHPRLGRSLRIFSIRQPLAELVESLNEFDPAVVSGFLGMLQVLAGEQEAGRLHLKPALLIPGGETVTDGIRARLTHAFGAPVRSAYAATECSYLSTQCSEGWYHVNSDWAVLEPVDADHRPTPPGEFSHTVLLSNLANRVQPFLRYDLGDSVLQRPDACPCGNPLPAVQVQGRSADLLRFPGRRGEPAELSSMLFGTLLDRVPGIQQYQVVQTAPADLRVRLRLADGADGEQTWRAVRTELGTLLTEHAITGIAVERAPEPPQQEPGGKFRRVIPLAVV